MGSRWYGCRYRKSWFKQFSQMPVGDNDLSQRISWSWVQALTPLVQKVFFISVRDRQYLAGSHRHVCKYRSSPSERSSRISVRDVSYLSGSYWYMSNCINFYCHKRFSDAGERYCNSLPLSLTFVQLSKLLLFDSRFLCRREIAVLRRALNGGMLVPPSPASNFSIITAER